MAAVLAWPALLSLVGFVALALRMTGAGTATSTTTGTPAGPLEPAGPAAEDEATEPAVRAWALLWRAGATSVVLRLILLTVIGLTPLGAWLLAPISLAGTTFTYLLTLAALVLLAWLPSVIVRGRREQAYGLLPRLRPLRRTGPAARAVRLRTGLLALAFAAVVVGASTGSNLEWLALGVYCLVLAALVFSSRRSRDGSAAGFLAPDLTLPPEQGADRLAAARRSLRLPAPAHTVPLVIGRVFGRPVNAYLLRVRKEWTVVVAPELVSGLTDRQLRALLGHELGHLRRGLSRRKLVTLTLWTSALLVGMWLPYLCWDSLGDWLTRGVSTAPQAHADAVLAAMQVAVGYLVLCLLRPLYLMALRADEADADRAMVQATGDPDGCADFLATIPRIWGSPRRWSTGQQLLIASHPSVLQRLAIVRAAPTDVPVW